MLTTLFRAALLYIFVIIIIRCIGKSGLSTSDPFQIVMTLMIAELATIPMESGDVPVVNGIAAVSMVAFLYAVSAFLSDRSEKFKVFLNGKPAILIDNGNINYDELKKSNITITDLAEMIRLNNSASLSDVLYAYLETNGEFSILLKPEKAPVTREDMGISKPFRNMPCILISNGTFYRENLKKTNITDKQIYKVIKQKSLGKLSDILLCFCDEDRQLYFYIIDGASKIPPVIVQGDSL
ncbi:MAG: DUF421 domain-containing protein [Firmicutes bacterium]|nr:DUF421 domain-containing protein [Bacillota bacterium]